MSNKKFVLLSLALLVSLGISSLVLATWSTSTFQAKLHCPPPGNGSFGDCLSGLEPQITSCPADAQTLDTSTVQVGNNTSVTAELRFSKHCNASWVRLSVVGSPAMINELGMHQDTGYDVKTYPPDSNYTVGAASSFVSPIVYHKNNHKAYGYFIVRSKEYRTKSM